MLVRRLNLAWKSGHPNQSLRLGDNAKTDRTLRARFRESASYGSALIFRATTCFLSTHALHEKPISLLANHSNKFFHAKLGEPNPMKHPFLLLAQHFFSVRLQLMRRQPKALLLPAHRRHPQPHPPLRQRSIARFPS
jgi:hypothetical protein